MTAQQLIGQATNALIDNLGILETIRFLTLKRQGRLESVERRRAWQSGLDKEVFFDEIFDRGNGNQTESLGRQKDACPLYSAFKKLS